MKILSKILPVVGLVGFLFALSSCEKEIDMDYHSVEPLYVVEAGISEEGAVARISQTQNVTDEMGKRPVSDAELEPEYCNYADIYYTEEGENEIPDYSQSDEDMAFSSEIFGKGFF